MTRKVSVLTGSRADFGLLRALLIKLRKDSSILLQLIVTGSHLSDAFGNTYREIENAGFDISAHVAIPLEGDSKAEMAKATGLAMTAYAEFFERNHPDLLVVLGDRFEIFAAAAAAMIQGIAIAHISGGDVTEGALDDTFRHCITKMSLLHFPGCRQSAMHIIQLGEDPSRVFNVGEPGVENCLSLTPMSRSELQATIAIDITTKPFAVVTFHPSTMEDDSGPGQVWELISALEHFQNINFIITKANADAGSRAINHIWEEQAKTHVNWLLVPSLGLTRYISAMNYAELIIGNSSSGVVEAPAMKKPSVNIGNRQKGRMLADSIICCEPVSEDITRAIKRALSPEFKGIAANVVNPFGDEQTSQRIFDIIKQYLNDGPYKIEKKFYDFGVTL